MIGLDAIKDILTVIRRSPMNPEEFQSLVRLGSVLQWSVVILILLAGSLQVYKFFVDKRVQDIRQEAVRRKTVQYEKTISELKDRIEQQIEQVEVVLEREKGRTIPRHLISQVRNELSKYEGTSIRLNCLQGDQEALAFSKELKEIFEKAGWRVNGVNQVPYNTPIKNIVIVLNSASQKGKANYIFSLFRALNYRSTARLNKNQTEDLGIMVGTRE
jgi:anion-transporting  ArsA/GET3 family ATPase